MTLWTNRQSKLLGGARKWWAVSGQTCIAAYEPQGAASLAASYINLVNPGTYDLTAPTAAPTWDAVGGWQFDGLATYLNTGISLPNNQNCSAAIWFSDISGTGVLFGVSGSAPARFFYIAPRFDASNVIYTNGARSGIVKGPAQTRGMLAIAGANAYRQGNQEPGTFTDAPTGTYSSRTPHIGRHSASSPIYCNAKVQRLSIYSTTLSQADVRLLLTRKPVTPTTGQLVCFGDSITAGTGASDAAHRWTNIVAAARSLTLRNSGTAGTVLQNTVQNATATIGAAADSNGRDTYVSRVIGYLPEYVCILYGLNDLRLNDVAFSVANYANDLTEIVDGIRASGTAATKIVVGSPPYVKASSYAGSVAPWDGGTAEKHAEYVAAAASVAAAQGVQYVDVYAAMVAGGGDSLVGADAVHPNDAGHAAIAAAFLTVI